MPERQPIHKSLEALQTSERAPYSVNIRRALRLGATSLSLLSAAYTTDVVIGHAIEEQAEIKVNVIDSSPLDEANSNQAIIALDGFRSVDGDDVAENLGPIIQEQFFDAEVWSLDTGNVPRDVRNAAKAIANQVEERGITSVAIVANSQGGIDGCDTINYLMSDAGIPTELFVMVSTPSSEDAVRNGNEQAIEFAKVAKNIKGIEYSNIFRFVTEAYFQRARIKDVGSFGQVLGGVADSMYNNTSPTMGTQINQALSVANADFDRCAERIAEHSPAFQMPVSVYAETAAPGWDYMVNDDKSRKDISLSFSRSGLQILGMEVPGMVHSRTDINKEEFNTEAVSIKELVRDAIEREKVKAFGYNDAYINRFIK